MSGNNEVKNSEGEDSAPNNDNTNSTTHPTNVDPVWMSLLEVTDHDKDNDPGDYDRFRSNYDLNKNNVIDNDNTSQGEGYVCMTVTDSWLPLKEDEYEDDDILIPLDLFNVGGNPNIHPNFFNVTLNNSLGCPYINDSPIFNT